MTASERLHPRSLSATPRLWKAQAQPPPPEEPEEQLGQEATRPRSALGEVEPEAQWEIALEVALEAQQEAPQLGALRSQVRLELGSSTVGELVADGG